MGRPSNSTDLYEGVHAVSPHQDAVLARHRLEGTAAIASVLQQSRRLYSVYQPINLWGNVILRVFPICLKA